MGIIQGIIAAWKLIKWIRSEKRQLEANVDAYLTKDRALEWRLQAEKIFHILESGSSFYQGLKKLPAPVRWFFKATTADNRVGKFGQWFLKSEKLKENSEVLDQPLYRTH